MSFHIDPVRLVIAGSRSVSPTDEQITAAVHQLAENLLGSFVEVAEAMADIPTWIVEVISGDAAGADSAGNDWARRRGIPVHHEPILAADVERYGKYVGPKIRNKRMAERGTHAIALWDGTSNGTTDMVTRMVLRRKLVIVVPSQPRRRAQPPPAKESKPCCRRNFDEPGTHDLACPTNRKRGSKP